MAGVNIAVGNLSASFNPAGKLFPPTLWFSLYSINPEPVKYPLTTASIGNILSFLTIIALSLTISGTETEIIWLSTISDNCSNHQRESFVRIFPLSGINVGRTQSKAEILSEATTSNS